MKFYFRGVFSCNSNRQNYIVWEKPKRSMFNKVNGSSSEPFWRDKYDMVSKKHHSTKQELVRVDSEVDVLKKLFTPKMARILVEKMQQDYDTLKLPTWMKDATGEWLDSDESKSKSCIGLHKLISTSRSIIVPQLVPTTYVHLQRTKMLL